MVSKAFEDWAMPELGQKKLNIKISNIIVLFLLGFVCQFMGQAFITHALAYLPASTSSLSLLIQPIAATGLGYLFFQEKLTIWVIIQFFLVSFERLENADKNLKVLPGNFWALFIHWFLFFD